MSLPRLVGKLNYYTMEVGDGREIELSIVNDYFCWRRVGDTKWIQLFPLSDLVPVKGEDYLTQEDIDYVGEIVSSQLKDSLHHSDLAGVDDPNQHPMSSITGLVERIEDLEEALADRLVVNRTAMTAGDILVVSEDGNNAECCGHSVQDIMQMAEDNAPVKGVDYFTPEEVQEIAEIAASMVEIPDVPSNPDTPGNPTVDCNCEDQVFNAQTHYDFPSVGDPDVIYKAEEEKQLYQWNSSELRYEVLNETTIEYVRIIDGGNSEASVTEDVNIIYGGNAYGEDEN